MKTFILSLFFAFFGSVSFAQNNEGCIEMARMADLAMEFRQSGGYLYELIEGTADNSKWHPLFEVAFTEPVWDTPRERKLARLNFSNEMYRICVELAREEPL